MSSSGSEGHELSGEFGSGISTLQVDSSSLMSYTGGFSGKFGTFPGMYINRDRPGSIIRRPSGGTWIGPTGGSCSGVTVGEFSEFGSDFEDMGFRSAISAVIEQLSVKVSCNELLRRSGDGGQASEQINDDVRRSGDFACVSGGWAGTKSYQVAGPVSVGSGGFSGEIIGDDG